MPTTTKKDYFVITNVDRVDLFDGNGNFLVNLFTIDYQDAGGSMYGMTIDSKGDLCNISSGGRMLKYYMNYP